VISAIYEIAVAALISGPSKVCSTRFGDLVPHSRLGEPGDLPGRDRGKARRLAWWNRQPGCRKVADRRTHERLQWEVAHNVLEGEDRLTSLLISFDGLVQPTV